MAAGRSDVLQGTLSLLVLKTLTRERMHGYAIAAYIRRMSRGALRVEEGSLYPALRRLEQEGVIDSEWGATETGRRARIYSLTAHGRRRLLQEEEHWSRLTAGVAAVLRGRAGPRIRQSSGAW